ncbi:MAG: NUMOD3 domain-containing DNA-binding protein, partial [Candidatus Thermoplasmatota archaeon]|nr:NUMOD3 domain-containing DNA-binding protein [Candidatus Thermoplasmatota archaeon]
MNQEEKFCKCGCGQIVNSWRGKPREFIKGHNYRLNLSWGSGRPLSDETKQKLSEAHKGIETWNKGKKWKKGVINEGESRIIKPKYKSSKSVTKKPKYNQFVACACGCREPIRAIDKYGHSRTFKKGHHNRQLPPNSGTFGKARKTVEVMAKSQLEKGRGSGNFCLCGCGTEIPKGSHYLRGHLQKNGMPKHECSCGCGVLIQAYFNDGSERRFVLGHQHRNKPSWNKGIKGAMGRPWNKDKELSEKHKTKLSIIKMNSTLKIFYNVPKKVAEGIDFLMWEGSYKELKCACGCGEPVRSRRYYFAIGHRSRLKRVRTTCACGCGTEISAYDERGRPMKFFSNHNSMSWLTTNTSIEIKIEEILNDLKIEF